MQVVYFSQRHEVLRDHEDRKTYGLELEIATLLKHDQSQHDDHSSLETSLPDPYEKVKNRQVVRTLKRVIQPWIILSDLELS